MRRMGVEEEYLLVDEAGRLKNAAGVVDDAARALGEQAAQPEIALTQAETATPVCDRLEQAGTSLRTSRTEFAAAAERHRARLLVAGTAPAGGWETQQTTPEPRYLKIRERYRQLADDQAIAGMHVHVEVADLQEAITVCDHIKLALPTLLALSSSSPLWEGRDTGYSSWRSMWFARWPTAGSSSPLGSTAAYEDLVAQLVETGTIDDPSNLYWDVRPSLRYPTVEIRVMDVCTRLADSLALAGLARATASWAATGRGLVVPVEVARGARWLAARDGLTGELVDLDGHRRPAAQVVQNLVTTVTPWLGDDRRTVETQITRILAEGTSSDRQRQHLLDGGNLTTLTGRLCTEAGTS